MLTGLALAFLGVANLWDEDLEPLGQDGVGLEHLLHIPVDLFPSILSCLVLAARVQELRIKVVGLFLHLFQVADGLLIILLLPRKLDNQPG